jgi:membrane associated rhomboid family serine protease
MVVPIYDENPLRLPHRPIITWGLIVLNILIYLAESGVVPVPDGMLTRLALTPAMFLGNNVMPDLLGPVLSLFTYMFLHADWGHVLGNMIFLWVFGDDVEEALGRVRFLIFYLACGALGGLTFVASDIYSDSALIGASGAVAGVVVAYVMLRPCAKVTVLVTIIPVRLSAYWVIGAFALMQIINLDSASRSEVAYWCHVGGMVAGALLLLVLRPAGVRLFDCMRPEPLPDGPSEPVSDASMPDASHMPRAPHRRH